jgi:TetR/AcrR family transcriptional regulator, transcriptional repressor for nem operon
MPYTPEHKQTTRARIVESARALFNRRGYVEVSIDEIMENAGLTRGGFYNHFASKEALFVEVVETYPNRNPTERWDEICFDPNACGAELARQVVNAYLSRAHLEDIGGQCPLIALPSDVARAGDGVKRAYRSLFEGMVQIMSGGFDAGRDNRERGLAITALCIGAMVLARSFDDQAYANEVREAARNLVLKAIQD